MGDAVAHFPAEFLGGLASGNRARAGRHPVLFRLVGKEEFQVNGEELLRYDGHLGEEIPRFLVNAAKPGLMCGQSHAWNAGDARFVILRQELGNGDPVPDDEAIGPRHTDAGVEGLFDGRQIAVEHKGDEDGEQGQQRAQLAAFEVAPNEVEKLHRLDASRRLNPACSKWWSPVRTSERPSSFITTKEMQSVSDQLLSERSA